MSKKPVTVISQSELSEMEDKTRADAPEGESLGADFWKEAKPVFPEHGKEQLTIRFDKEVIDYFKKQGKGYQTRMNAVLKAYVEAHSHETTT